MQNSGNFTRSAGYGTAIETPLGPDWNEPERALELHLALRLRALSGAP
jgi:hypothetical protein